MKSWFSRLIRYTASMAVESQTQQEPNPVLCPRCGYDLRGQLRERGEAESGTCSECGLEEGSREWKRLAARWPWRKRLALSLSMLFIIMYAPYSWLLFIDYPWSDYHWLWVKIWLGLPGLVLFHGFESEVAQFGGAHAFSFVVLAIA